MNRYQYQSGDLTENPWISLPNNGGEVGELFEIAEELNKLRDWIVSAAPILNTASCIVVEDSPGRIDEIAGCRAIIETCPVDWQNTP
jgi:hypothetical protein